MKPRKRYKNKINISDEKIREIREANHLSREKLSSKLLLELNIDLSVSSIEKIERGKRPVVDYELWGIAKILEIDMKNLINNII